VIRVVVDDLAFVVADAIVRPATALLEPTTPTLRRLEQVGGRRFWSQLEAERELAVGSAVVTGGGDLTAELVIHAIIQSAAEPVTRDSVRRALTAALQRAADWHLAHVAIPPLGIGAGNLSLEDAAQTMATVLAGTPGGTGYPQDVTVVVDSDEERRVFETSLRLPDR
jgi:O-acetyl-ADP-ribose deacetylase (regulator of RNase III)